MKCYILLFSLLIFNSSLYAQWKILNGDGIFHDIDFVNDQVGWIAAGKTLLKTSDGGYTWDHIQFSIPWDEPIGIYNVDFITESIGWGFAKTEYYARDAIIVKSLDGGQTWSIQRDDALNELFAVNDKLVFAVGNQKILKTIDGGLSWIDMYKNKRKIYFLSAWFFNPDFGIVIGEDGDNQQGIILRTSDGGNSWKEKGVPNFSELHSLKFVNDSTGYFLANDYENYLCFTTDTCNSWTVMNDSTFNISCFDVIDNQKIYAVIRDSLWNEYLMLSNDGGITWERIAKPLPPGWDCDEIYFYNSNNGFLLSTLLRGRGELGKSFLKSTDGGYNWIIQQMTYPFKDIFFLDSELVFVSGGISEWHGGSGDLFKTNDEGLTWIQCFHSLNEVKSVFFVDPLVGFILSTRTNTGSKTNIHKTVNSGIIWEEVYADDNDSTGFFFSGREMYFVNNKIGWVVGAGFDNGSSGAAFLYTNDGGESWDVSWITMDTDLYHYALNSIHFVGQTSGWAVGESGLIVRYSQYDQWQAMTSITDLPLKDVFFSDENHGWIAGGYLNEQDFKFIFLKTIDAGKNWKEYPDFKYQINDMFFENNLHGWAVGNDECYTGNWRELSNCGVMLETTDGGENWKLIKSGLSAPLNAIHFKDNIGWAVGDNGLVLRTEDGLTWIDQSTEEPYPQKYQLHQNYPNPFNPKTVISYKLKVKSDVELSIYNLLGQKVVTLVNKKQAGGSYQVEWDASGFSTGVYFYRLQTDDGFIQTMKLLLLK